MSSNQMLDGFPIISDVAQKVWKNFERELAHKLKPLPEAERDDIRLEILSHLFDSALNDQASSEEIRFINAIERLGKPDDYLTPLVSDILLQQQTRKGNPLAVLESILVAASRGIIHTLIIMVLGFAYFHTVMLFVMSVMHIGDPDIGLWLYDTGGYALSFEAQPGGVQWLPQWFSVIGISISSTVYWLLNKVLVLLLRKTRASSI